MITIKHQVLNRLTVYMILACIGVSFKCPGQVQPSFKDSIVRLTEQSMGTVGISALHIKTLEKYQVNGDRHFPMQSVMKFPLALTVLHQVDQGKLSLSQRVHLTKEDLSIPAVSPIRDKYPDGDVDLTIAELLSYTVSQSDNNGCDKLFQLLGGTRTVNDHIYRLGVKDIAIVATEKEMGQNWQTQYTNYCTPNAMLKLLTLFNSGKLLSPSSQDFLWKLMLATVNAPDRIKGLLPADALVAHKPGTSSVNSKGIAAATNDVGIVELPNKERFAIAIFVSDATAELKIREEIIARITRVLWDHWQ